MNTYTFPFEKLEAWQDAKKSVLDIYATTREFPQDEKFGLSSQINRVAVSVGLNLAEGSCRTSLKDQAYFSQLAYSSLMELACQIAIAGELTFLNKEKYDILRNDIEILSKKLNALRNSQIKRAAK